MGMFLARIELHDAKYQDYVNLHAHMTQEGFTTAIKGNDGYWYKLPPAEYHLVADLTAVQVRDKASCAAEKTRLASEIVVSGYINAAWTGLQKVDTRAAG